MTERDELIIEIQGQVKGLETKLDDVDAVAMQVYTEATEKEMDAAKRDVQAMREARLQVAQRNSKHNRQAMKICKQQHKELQGR